MRSMISLAVALPGAEDSVVAAADAKLLRALLVVWHGMKGRTRSLGVDRGGRDTPPLLPLPLPRPRARGVLAKRRLGLKRLHRLKKRLKERLKEWLEDWLTERLKGQLTE